MRSAYSCAQVARAALAQIISIFNSERWSNHHLSCHQ